MSLMFWTIFGAVLLLNLIVDAIWIKRNSGTAGSLPHTISVLVRGALFSYNAAREVGFDGYLYWEEMLLWIIYQAIIFWIIFDPVLNVLIGRKPFTKGSTAFLDWAFPSFGLQLVVKLLILGFTIWWMSHAGVSFF